MIVLLMGPSGAGKTTTGLALARATRWTFYDADDFHPESNVVKMRAGTSLTDADRAPWLDRLHTLMHSLDERREDAVLACSALRESYRRQLDAGIANVRWVYLDTPAAVLQQRLDARRGHFAGAAILADQLRALEVPDEALTVFSDRPVGDIVEEICAKLHLACDLLDSRLP